MLRAGKNIEVWMVELNLAMCAAVRDHMIRAVRCYADTPRTQWMLDWPGQVVLNGSQVHWTLETEKALQEKGNQGVYDYYEQIKSQLADMVVLIRTGLSSNQRTTVGALAVIDVHARDVMKAMADAGVSESTDFDWQSDAASVELQLWEAGVGATHPHRDAVSRRRRCHAGRRCASTGRGRMQMATCG